MKLEWSISNRNLGHLCLYALCKVLFTQYGSPDLAIIQSLSCATEKLKRSVARSHSLVVYSDIDVVPTVMCQWGGEGHSQHPSMGVGRCVEREKTESLCKCVYTHCVYCMPFFSGLGSHTRLMACVEVFKRKLQLLQTEPMDQIRPTLVDTALHSLMLWRVQL